MAGADLSPHARLAHDLLHGLSSAGAPAVSPDGGHVAFVVATIDVDRNTTVARIWLDATPLTAGPKDANPVWSPDGHHLAFVRVAEGSKEATLCLMPVDGPGEVRTLCSMPDGLEQLAWSPDGAMIAFVSRTRHHRYECPDVSWQPPRRIDRFYSRLNGEDWVFDRPAHIHVVAVDGTSGPRNLTPDEFQYGEPAWMPDSSALVVSSARHDTWDTDLCSGLYRVELDGSIGSITGPTGVHAHPSPSPDGSWISFLGVDDPLVYPQNVKVGIIRPDGTGRRWISEGLDRNFQTSSADRAAVWLDTERLVAAVEDRGEQHLVRLDVAGSTPERLTDGPLMVHAYDIRSGTMVCAESGVDHTSDIVVTRNGERRRLTSLSTGHLTWERFAAPCHDDSDEIDAWIMRPADFDPTKRYPVLLNVHGGPFSQYGETFFDEAQMQARAGFVVLMSNPRGGSGRHQAWGQSIMGPTHRKISGTGWGTVDVDDVLAALDTALARFEFCDPDRVGMLGGSYGGYMATTLAARHGDRFRAICSERAVNNLLTEEWSSDIGGSFRAEHGPSPVEDPDEYLRMSPSRLARDIRVPMLLIHSEEDWRCPINQAEELWMTLKMLGRDVVFYRFPGENHELSRSGSPVHRMQRAEIILDFFTQHLSGDRHDAPV